MGSDPKEIIFHIYKEMKQFRCNFCGKNFKENGNLKNHIRLHSGYRPYVCKYFDCGKTFVTLGNLKSHEYNHSEKKPFKCSFTGCGRFYSRLCRLEIHERTHIGFKPFRCPYQNCEKSFNEKGNLKTHVRIHTGEKPFACDFPGCGLSFKAHGHLKDHKKRHTNTRPYKCHLCDNAFARSSTLKIHLHTHQGDKPHKCPFRGCNKFFSEKGNMKSHYKNHFINKKNFNQRFEIDNKFVRYGNNIPNPNAASVSEKESEREIEVVYSELLNLKNDLKINDSQNNQFSISSDFDSKINVETRNKVQSSCNNLLMDNLGFKSVKQNYHPEIRKIRRIRKPLSDLDIIRKYNFFRKKYEEINDVKKLEKIGNQDATSSSIILKRSDFGANDNSADKSLKGLENIKDQESNVDQNNLRDFPCKDSYQNNNGLGINNIFNDLDKSKIALRTIINEKNPSSNYIFNSNNVYSNPIPIVPLTNPNNVNNISQNINLNHNFLLNNFSLLNNYNNYFLLNGITMINGNNALVNNNNNNILFNNNVPHTNNLNSCNINQQLEFLKYNSNNLNNNPNFRGTQLNYNDFLLFPEKK